MVFHYRQSRSTPLHSQQSTAIRRKRRSTGFSLRNRKGTTLVELAFVLPVFLLFMFALFEFGHILMVSNSLTSIAKQAAHRGTFEDSSTADVLSFANAKLNTVLGAGVASVVVKNGSAYETTGDVDIDAQADIELATADSRQLYVVRIEVPYDSVAIMPPFWVKNITLEGSSIMRRE